MLIFFRKLRRSDLSRLAVHPSKQLTSSKRVIIIQNPLKEVYKKTIQKIKSSRNNRRSGLSKDLRSDLSQGKLQLIKRDKSTVLSRTGSALNFGSVERRRLFDKGYLRIEDQNERTTIDNDSRFNTKRSLVTSNFVLDSQSKAELRSSRCRLRRLVEVSTSPAPVSRGKRLPKSARPNSNTILVQKKFMNMSPKVSGKKGGKSNSACSKKSTRSYKNLLQFDYQLKSSNFTVLNTTRTNPTTIIKKRPNFSVLESEQAPEDNFPSVMTAEKGKNESILMKNLMGESRRKRHMKSTSSILDFRMSKSRDRSGNINYLQEEKKKFFPLNKSNIRSTSKFTSKADCKCELIDAKSRNSSQKLVMDIKANAKFAERISDLNKEIINLKREVRRVDKQIKGVHNSGYNKVLQVEKILKTSARSINIREDLPNSTRDISVARGLDLTPQMKRKKRELSLTNFKHLQKSKSRREHNLKTLRNKKTKSLTNISFTAQKLKFDLKAISFQIEKISKKHEQLLVENDKNKQELSSRYKKMYQNQRNSNIDLLGCEKQLKKNNKLKKTLKRFEKKMGKMLKRKVREIEETCRKQLEMEVKLLEMRYVGTVNLIKKDIGDYITGLVERNQELRRSKLGRFQFN